MTKNPMRYFIWGGVLLLVCIVMVSYLEEAYGFDEFYEINCDTAAPRTCSPSGRRVLVLRTPAAPKREASVRIEVYRDDGRLESRVDLPGCKIPDANNFACRKPLGASLDASKGSGEALWTMAQGKLFNNAYVTGTKHYFNGHQLWRNRLLFGSYEL